MTDKSGPAKSIARHGAHTHPRRIPKREYEKELTRLQRELVRLQEWVRREGLKVCILFEGRDAAGKGGSIKRIAERTNPRIVRVVALDKPTERETTQWYFQRYVAHLPAAGEIVLFDRSWYNRAGVERVMGFCRDDEQERRFRGRIDNVEKRWKLSPMDLESRAHWVDYSKAKDRMFATTDTKASPWWVVDADDKRRARLNCISHILNSIPYEDLTSTRLEMPTRQADTYVRPPIDTQTYVPDLYGGDRPQP